MRSEQRHLLNRQHWESVSQTSLVERHLRAAPIRVLRSEALDKAKLLVCASKAAQSEVVGRRRAPSLDRRYFARGRRVREAGPGDGTPACRREITPSDRTEAAAVELRGAGRDGLRSQRDLMMLAGNTAGARGRCQELQPWIPAHGGGPLLSRPDAVAGVPVRGGSRPVGAPMARRGPLGIPGLLGSWALTVLCHVPKARTMGRGRCSNKL
ncbi:hypothetical protein AAFF_G00414450 [Aldrovandia affinis]|uniref:Uncharacterized protein n=1 Tax=Aldrovandia affinis TaxID=143900 RepID=A0AAD7SD05_9TELE|nr:hypothetical protein AAFF_G00414450 [Aldrovandia affinis]